MRFFFIAGSDTEGASSACGNSAAWSTAHRRLAPLQGHLGDGKDIFTQSTAKATSYYQRGCTLGDSGGCARYGDMIKDSDPAGAVAAWRTACDAPKNPDAAACASLGEAYESGKGVAANAATAKALYVKSCKLSEYSDACAKVKPKRR